MFYFARSTNSIQRKIIVASDSLKNIYDTSSSTQKPIIIYNINDTLPYLADFDGQKKVLKITAKQFLSGTFDNRIHIFFIIDATEDDINDIMRNIQQRNGNECFVIVETEDELAQIQQHQQYVQERSDSENIASLQSNISNLEKLLPKTLHEFEQGLKSPNNYFLISKGLPQHIRKFYNDIYQISNCPIVENFFANLMKMENVFAGKITDDNPGIVKNINVDVGKHLEIEDGTYRNYYIIPLCDITVYKTQKREPQSTLNPLNASEHLFNLFEYRLMEKSPSIISKVIMTTGGQETCAAGTNFLNYLQGYQLCFYDDFRSVLKDILLPSLWDMKAISNATKLVTNLDNLSYISVVARELIGGPVANEYEKYLKDKQVLERQIELNQLGLSKLEGKPKPLSDLRNEINEQQNRSKKIENEFKTKGVKAKQKIDALHDIFNSYDSESKKLLKDKISYAKILEYEYNDQ